MPKYCKNLQVMHVSDPLSILCVSATSRLSMQDAKTALAYGPINGDRSTWAHAHAIHSHALEASKVGHIRGLKPLKFYKEL